MARRDLTFRVFVSSPLRDMIVERSALQEHTFPSRALSRVRPGVSAARHRDESSTWTLREYSFSFEGKVPVFLLKVREIGPTLAIAGEHYIDFIQDEARGFRKLHGELAPKNL